MNRAPTSIKPKLSEGPAASRKVIAGGIKLGQTLMPNPVNPKKISMSAARNGTLS